MRGSAWRLLTIGGCHEIPLLSSAKADDPVRRDVSALSSAVGYWMPAFAGMTAVLPRNTAVIIGEGEGG
jgi:hypothetical protein